MRILLASSPRPIQSALEKTLMEKGYSVRAARNAHDAFDALENEINRFDAIVATNDPDTEAESLYAVVRAACDRLPFMLVQTDSEDRFEGDYSLIQCRPGMAEALATELDAAELSRLAREVGSCAK